MVRDALTDPALMPDIVSYARQNDITDIFIQVRARGEVYYPTDNPIPVRAGNQALALLIEGAHKKNIRVHAWINTHFIWSGQKAPADENHIYNLQKNSLFSPAEQKEPGYFIYPGDNRNLDEIKMIIRDMITEYKVDGIHLDYFRYPFNRLPMAVQSRIDFQQKFFVDPLRLKTDTEGVYERIIEKNYRSLLKQKLTNALRAIKTQIVQLDTLVTLSLAVKPNPYIAEVRFMQPWEKWLKDNICDFVVVMNYDPAEKGFYAVLNVLNKKNYRDKVLIGIGVYNISAGEVRKRIKKITVSNFAGYALFSYNYIRKHTKHFYNLKSY